ncbi:geranylgeranyl diphosphate synthase, type II [bacterium A37T11]|nr:geranylgeranyl diphosphate synthase, type II [bacterium A37T11]
MEAISYLRCMYTLTTLQALISRSIEELEFPIQVTGITEPIRYFLRIGGKRLRPALVLMATDLFGGNVASALPAALAIEYYHNFTLIHDDIMDHAPLRRGHQTIHKKWDHNTAILAGDALLVLAYQSLSNCPPSLLSPLMAAFNKSAMEVCEGQQYDLEFEKRTYVTEAEYLHMIRLKTAVLLGTSLELGAILGGASKEDALSCYELGVNTGIAFQLQDDMLDVYGEAKKFGKLVGGDIIANKKTWLLIKALELANTSQKDTLQKWLQHPAPEPLEKVRVITQIYDELDIRQEAEKKMNFYAKSAETLLDNIQAPALRKGVLHDFIDQLFVRES